MEKSLSSALSSTIVRVRLTVLRFGFKFRLGMSRVRVPAPSRLLLALLSGYGVHAMALPTGGQVASGNVTIGTPQNGSLNITQTSNKGIVNWDSFNVGSGEKVNFLQPGATSATLNRVVGNDASTIFGQINANGQVFLLNSNGVLFAPGSSVNVGGLLASTLQLQDADFLAGNYSLTGAGKGTIDNRGVIKAGYAVLAGGQVSNTGIIDATGGTAALVAGDRVTMNLTGSDVLSVSVDAPTAAALVHSGGIVKADGGQVVISAKAASALLDTVVNVDGVVQAHSIGTRNGTIVLDGGSAGVVSVTGTGKLDASGAGAGQTGGTVKVLGANVGLFDTASIDASGDAGGGVVRLGGDWHGQGPDANALQTILGADASIRADAITHGNGGDVVLWSQDKTQFLGRIDVHGGALDGSGGNVETSSHAVLQALGTVDGASAHGSGGNWLLDPNNITITTANDLHGGYVGGTFTSDNDSSNVDNASIKSHLTSGNVTIVTASAGTNLQAGTITVDAPINPSLGGGTAPTLTLQAQSDIIFTNNGVINPNSGKINVVLNAGTDGNGTGTPGVNPGAVTMQTGSSINTHGGFFQVTAQGDVQLSTVSLGAGNGTVNTGGGDLTQLGSITASGTLTIDTSRSGHPSGDVTLHDSGNSVGRLIVTKADDVGYNGAGAISLGTIDAASLTLVADNAISQHSGDSLTISGNTSATSASSSIDLSSSGNSLHEFEGAAHTTVNVTSSGGTLLLGNISGTGLTVTTHVGGVNGDISQAGGTSLNVSGLAALNAGSGAIDVDTSTNTGSFGATGANVTVRSTHDLLLDDVAASGIVRGTAVGDITQVGGKTVDTPSSGIFTSTGGGDIRLQNAGNSIGALGATTTGDIFVTVANSGALNLGSISAHDLTIDSSANDKDVVQVGGGTALTIGGALTVNAGAGNIDVGSSTSNVHSFGAIGTDIQVTTPHPLILDNVSGASLTVAANGAITQSTGNAVQVTGDGSFHAVAGNVLLDNANNRIGNLGAVTTGDVDVKLANATSANLGDIQAASLTVDTTAHGADLGQVGGTSLTISGATTLHTGGGDANIGSAGSDLHSFGATGNAITVTTGQPLALDDVTSLSLAVHADGAVTQNAGTKLVIGGNATFAAGAGNVTIQNANNALGSFGATTTGDVAVTESGSLVLGDITAANLAAVHTGAGNVTQLNNAIRVAGTTTITAGSGSITLGGNNNSLGTLVASSSGAVAVANNADLTLGNIGASALSVTTTGGDVTQGAGALAVGTSTAILTGTGDVTVGSGTSTVGTFSATGHDVTVTSNAPAVLGDVTTTHDLTVTATTGVTQGAGTALHVGGAATFNVASGNVTVANSGNAIGGITTSTAGDVAVASTSDIALGDITAANLAVTTTTGAGVSQASGTSLLVGTSTTVSAGAGDVAVGSAGSAVGTFTATGHDVGVTTSAALVLGNVTASHNFTAAANGNISQGAGSALHVTGDAQLGATGGNVTIANAGNTFGSFGANTTGDVSVTEAGTLTLGAVTAANLSVVTTGGGDVGQKAGTSLNIGTATTVDAGTGDVTIGGNTGGLGILTVTGHDVNATSGSALTLGNVTATGDLAVTTSGDVTQQAGSALHVNGGATFAAGAGNVNVANVGNNFATFGANTTGDVTLVQGAPLALTAIHAGNLSIDSSGANGNISQASGDLTVGGTATLNAGTGDIHVGSGASAIQAFAATGHDVQVTTGHATALDDVTATGNLTVTASGDITQVATKALHVTGNAAFAAGSGNIVIDGANTFATFAANTSGAVHLTQAGAVALGNISAGALTVDTHAGNGNIEQASGSITQVTGAASFDAGAGRVDFAIPASNTFGSFSATAGTAVTVIAENGLVLGNVTTGQLVLDLNSGGSTLPVTQAPGTSLQVSGATSIHANHADITLGGANGVGTLDLVGHDIQFTSAGAQVLGGVHANSASINAAGPVSEAPGGVLAIDHLLQVATSSGDVTLTEPANAVGQFAVTTPGSASLTTVSALQLGNVASGALNLIAGGDLTQAPGAAFSVVGATTLDAGAHAVVLANATNDFGGPVSVSGQSVSLRDANDLTINALTNGANGQVLLVAGGTLTTPAGNLDTGSGDLNLTSGGAIVTPGTLSGANVTIQGQGGVQIANDVTASGNLVIATDGSHDIVQVSTATASVQGTTTLSAGAGTIDLEGSNSFANPVTATGGNVTIKAAGALVAHVTAGGFASLASTGGALTVDGSSGGNLTASGTSISFGGLNVGANLGAASTGGDIVQTGALTVHGTSVVNAGAGHVTLTAVGNDFGGATSFAAASVSVADTNGLAAHVTTTGDATFDAAASLAVDGDVGGKLTAGGAGVTLGTATSSTTHAGSLAITSTGTVAELGTVAVTGLTSLAAGAHDIILGNAGNDFGGAVSVTGGAVTLADASALNVNLVSATSATLTAGGATTVNGATTGALSVQGSGIVFGATDVGGTLNAASTGAITQSGALHVGGASTLASGAGSMTLANSGNSFGGGVTVSGATIDVEQGAALTAHLNGAGSATLRSGAALTVNGTATGDVTTSGTSIAFGTTHVDGGLTAQAAGGAITQTGDLAVGGASSFQAGTHDVSLTRSGNAFAGAVTANGAKVDLAAAGNLSAHLTASAAASVGAGGAATVDGTVGASLTVDASSANFGTTTVGGDLAVTTTGAPHAFAQQSNGATPQAAGAGGIAQTGPMTVAGSASFNAGAGDIVLDNVANSFAHGVTATGGDIDIANATAMLADVKASGDAILTAKTGQLEVQGTIAGALTATGGSVLIDAPAGFALNGKLTATATESSVQLGAIHAAGAEITAVGDVLLDGTLTSSSDVAISGASIRGVGGNGALDVAAGRSTTLTSQGDIGRAADSPQGVPDANGIIALRGVTGQGTGTLFLSFPSGHTAWFSVDTKEQFQGASIAEDSTLGTSTFGCTSTICINFLGQTASIADSVIANILSAAAQDAADAAFGTENLDVAIRKAYVTTIGRVPPGIDEIAGDLGSSQCDSRVTSSKAISADKACPVKAK